MNKLFAGLFFSVCFGQLKAQYTTVVPMSYLAGNTSTAAVEDWLPFHTPASLASETNVSLHFQVENRYLTKELFNEIFQLGLRTEYLNVGVSVSHFGYDNYHELMVGIAFARTFKKRLNVGIQANYYTIYFPQSDIFRGTVLAQVGIQGEISRNFYLAIHAFNVTFSSIKSNGLQQRIPSVFSIGTWHRINKQLNWSAQIDKEIGTSLRGAVGVEYAPYEQFAVRFGTYVWPITPSFGVRLNFGGFQFNLHCEYHLTLGLCTLGALKYRF